MKTILLFLGKNICNQKIEKEICVLEEELNSMHTNITNKQKMRETFLLSIAVAMSFFVILEFIAIIFLYNRQKIDIPYVVEINRDGEVKYNREASSRLAEWKPSTATKIKILKDYITDLRSISFDEYIQIGRIKNIYAFSIENALKEAEKYLVETDPLSKIGKQRVEVNVYASTPLIDDNENLFQLDWNEKKYSANGTLLNEQNYRAIIAIKHFLPNTQEVQSINPLGIYVSELKISAIKDGYIIYD